MSLKRGFTLIELLAVIIILAIVALIATPIILDVVDDARKSAGLSESNMIYTSINNYCASIEMKKQLGTLGSEDVDCSSKTTFTNDEISKMVNLGSATVESNSYSNGKLTSLKVISNKHTYVLCANGSMALEGECDANAPIEPEEPSVPESVPFAEDSWETIAENVKNGNASIYNVGDEKEVTLTGDWAGTYTVRIANNSTPAECSNEGFSQTACGFVVEFVDIITSHKMNSTGTNSGGWPASEMYSFVNTDIYNTLPSDLQDVIIDTHSVSGHGFYESTNFTSTDKLYLLSTKEVWGKDGTSNAVINDTAEAETRQLDYYKNNGVTTDSYSGAVKTRRGSISYWCLRAANSSTSIGFYGVLTTGHWGDRNAILSCGVAPAFRIG